MARFLSKQKFLVMKPLGNTRMLEKSGQLNHYVKCMETESRLGFHSLSLTRSSASVQSIQKDSCVSKRFTSSHDKQFMLNSNHILTGRSHKPSPHRLGSRSLLQQTTEEWKQLSPEEKAEKYQRPKAQSTIDEEEVSKFSNLSALWWDEGGEFEALHSLNELRVPLIRNGIVSQKTLDQYNASKPLDDCWILDVGSGGGILSEPLARLGASVVGLDAAEENIKIAQAHLIHDPAIRDHIKYIHATVEDIAEEQAGKFDAVVASEVLEHVADADTFISSACQLVKPGGSIFFTTLNKTTLSYALGIVVAEHVLRLVSPGTHDWEKFITPRDLQFMLTKNDFSMRLVHGMWYNPLSKRWTWTKDTSINYAVHAVRAVREDVQTEDASNREGGENASQV